MRTSIAIRSVQDKIQRHREEMDQEVQRGPVGDEQTRPSNKGIGDEEARAQDEDTPDEAVEEKPLEEKAVEEKALQQKPLEERTVEEKAVEKRFLPVLQSKKANCSAEASENAFASIDVLSTENSDLVMKRRRSYEEQVNTDVSGPQSKRRAAVHGLTETSSLPLSLELFEIHNNGTKDYTIQQLNNETPSWKALRSLRCFVYGRETYSINDVVYVWLQGVQERTMARIVQIRDFGDDLKLICVLWYYSRAELQGSIDENAEPWPQDSSHLMSTHMQVLMSDTVIGKVHQQQLKMLAQGKVIDVYRRPYRVHNDDDPAVGWLLEL